MQVIIQKKKSITDEITEHRVKNPGIFSELLQKRKPVKPFSKNGFLSIIAADHPARSVIKAGANLEAMADRSRYLQRIIDILEVKAADGVMGTMDIIEELVLLNETRSANGSKSFLDDVLLIGSLNRAGLANSAWELNDPITSATPESCKRQNLDAAKMLLRIDESNRDSLPTINYCVQAINQCVDVQLPIFLEPLPVTVYEGKPTVSKDAGAFKKIVGVASGLGTSSAYTWLKLPYVENFHDVADATTLPIVLLGGEAGNEKRFYQQLELGMQSGSNVRGVMIGRNVLFPESTDHRIVAENVYKIVHKN